jgi:hypothetical protein
MKHRWTIVLTMALVALAATAHQTSSNGDTHPNTAVRTPHMATTDEYLKILSAKLNLTPDQQVKIKPVIENMLASIQKARENSSLPQQERISRMQAAHKKGESDLRALLNDEQKQKLDELDRERHAQSH